MHNPRPNCSMALPIADESVVAALLPWRLYLQEFGTTVLGSSAVYLQQKECSSRECNLGNFYTDAMLHNFISKTAYNSSSWTTVAIALTTQGNFRVPLPKGNLTYNHLITMCPWENKLFALNLKGHVIRDLLEDSVAPLSTNKSTSSRFLQVSGLKVVYNISQPVGQRVMSLKARCSQCSVPAYEDFDAQKDYRLVVMEYLANGKNGFGLIHDNARDLEQGSADLAAFIDFMKVNDPITTGVEGRIKIVK